MSSYSASAITVFNNVASTACGSFRNIQIDGRLSFENAKQVARDILKKEQPDCYLGFIIEKTSRAWAYKNPQVVDSDYKISEIENVF